MGKSIKQSELPFILENHPETYSGYPFITLIQYKHQHILSIVDNLDNKNLKGFVIDLCGPTDVDEQLIINVADHWYENSRDRYPISFEFSKRGLTKDSSRIYRTYSLDSIARVIGPIYIFPMNDVQRIKRRKRREIAATIEINKIVVLPD